MQPWRKKKEKDEKEPFNQIEEPKSIMEEGEGTRKEKRMEMGLWFFWFEGEKEGPLSGNVLVGPFKCLPKEKVNLGLQTKEERGVPFVHIAK